MIGWKESSSRTTEVLLWDLIYHCTLCTLQLFIGCVFQFLLDDRRTGQHIDDMFVFEILLLRYFTLALCLFTPSFLCTKLLGCFLKTYNHDVETEIDTMRMQAWHGLFFAFSNKKRHSLQSRCSPFRCTHVQLRIVAMTDTKAGHVYLQANEISCLLRWLSILCFNRSATAHGWSRTSGAGCLEFGRDLRKPARFTRERWATND